MNDPQHRVPVFKNPGTRKGILFVSMLFVALVAIVALQVFTSPVAQAQPGGRAVSNMGDADDLVYAATAPVTCTRAATGLGTIQGKITDTTTGQPVANAYIGISPGTVNSFACYTHTGTDGTYQFTKLNAGTYNLSASRWMVSGTAPLYRDSIVRQIPVGNSIATVNASLTPMRSPGVRVIGNMNAKNLIMVDMDETYFNSWFTDTNSVANPTVTPAVHGIAALGVNATEEWTQYGYSPIDHYQLATGAYPNWRTPDEPAAYWTQPDPALDTNLWYSGSATTGEEFAQESIFDVAKSYGMNTAIIGGNDYPAGHITNANVDEINLADPNPCSVPTAEVQSMESFINTHITNPNGFLLYAPLTQAEGFNTENVSPDAKPAVTSCSTENGWTYTQASIWDDQAFNMLLNYLKTTKQGSTSLFQNTAIVITADEAQNDKTNFDNFYPTQPGEPGLGTTRHTPFVMEGPNIYQNKTYSAQMRIDDFSVNAMAELGLPAPFDSRGKYIPQFFIKPPRVMSPPTQSRAPTQSQGYISLLENNVDGYTTTIQAQNEGTASITTAAITVYNQNGQVVVKKTYNAPVMTHGALVINAGHLGLPSGFSGTALIQADQALAVVSNESAATSGTPIESIEGYTAPETGSNLYAPVVLSNVQGTTSYLSITDLAPCSTCGTTATVSFYNAAGSLLTRTSANIAPFGRFRLSTTSIGLPAGTTASAVVTSSPAEPLAATIYTETKGGRSFAYNALSAGDKSLTASLIENGANSQTTALTLQNSASTSASVTVTYRGTNGATVATQKVTLPAYGSATELASGAGLPANFAGSALITANQNVTALVRISGSGRVSAYTPTRTQDYTLYTPVFAPQLQDNVGGVTSAITVTNTGTQTTTEKVQYYDYNGTAFGSSPTVTLSPGASYTFNQGDAASGLSAGFVGTAFISSSNNQHVAVVVTFSGNGNNRSYNGSQAQSGLLLIPINQLRQNYSTYSGLVVTLQNVTVTRSFGSNWFVQNSSGGLRIYVGGGAGQTAGDIETITGVLTDYNGELEIDPNDATAVIKTGTGPIPAPVTITTAQLAQLKYTSSIDGELVTVPLATITTYNPPTLGITDASKVEGTVYFDSASNANINLKNFHKGEQVKTTGVLQLYGNDLSSSSGELEPLLTSDFVAA